MSGHGRLVATGLFMCEHRTSCNYQCQRCYNTCYLSRNCVVHRQPPNSLREYSWQSLKRADEAGTDDMLAVPEHADVGIIARVGVAQVHIKTILLLPFKGTRQLQRKRIYVIA